MRTRDLSGQRFGRLVACHVVGKTKQGSAVWQCTCDCGSTKDVSSASLVSKSTRSCGCLAKENQPPIMKTHGKTRTPEYNSWRGMHDRCYRPSSRYYEIYGGRGITVCERWSTFENFLADMGEKPGPSYSIERRDTNGGYTPDNCMWADKTTQSYNRRSHGLPGVYFTRWNNWQARISKHNKVHILGTFDNLLDAAAARKSAELKFYGETK